MPELMLPEWLLNTTIFCMFDETSDDDGDEGGGSGEEDGDGDESEEEDQPDPKDKEHEEATKQLKSALDKERKARRDLQKQVKELNARLPKPPAKPKPQEGSEGSSEADELTAAEKQRADKAEATSVRLAEKLAKNAVDTKILSLVGKYKFKDADEVLALVNRSEIDVDQDPDDPAEIEIDSRSVEDAVKELAKKKPHLLIQETKTADGNPTGGNVGRGGKGKGAANAEALAKKFPALGRR